MPPCMDFFGTGKFAFLILKSILIPNLRNLEESTDGGREKGFCSSKVFTPI